MTTATRSSLPSATLARSTFHAVMLVEVDHPEGIVRAHTGAHDITVGGTLYPAAGALLTLEGVEDSGIDADPHTWTMGLSRTIPELARKALEPGFQDAGARVLVSVSADGKAWSTPVILKTGKVSTLVVTANAITLECVTASLDLGRVSDRAVYWTHDQQVTHVDPLDQTFITQSSIQEKQVSWP